METVLRQNPDQERTNQNAWSYLKTTLPYNNVQYFDKNENMVYSITPLNREHCNETSTRKIKDFMAKIIKWIWTLVDQKYK